MGNIKAEYREGGFDYVYDSQKVFKSLMETFTFPGKVVRLPLIPLSSPQPELGYVMEALLTLLDLEVSFCVCGSKPEETEAVRQYIHINTGSIEKVITEADYILFLDSQSQGRLNQAKSGSLESPNKAATAFYLVKDISEGTTPIRNAGVSVSVTGPGIRDSRDITLEGVEPSEVDSWIENRSEYPLGVDIYFISPKGYLCGLPRSVRISKKGDE
jgi:alpha-D-ribose 1-methylphosphonate 5-triphosphate synthase subunit PhnH